LIFYLGDIYTVILVFYFFFFMLPRTPSSTLFPYTTLFRSNVKPLPVSPESRISIRNVRGDISVRSGDDAQIHVDGHKNVKAWTGSEEHTSELQSPYDLVCRLLLEKKKNKNNTDRQTKRKKP